MVVGERYGVLSMKLCRQVLDGGSQVLDFFGSGLVGGAKIGDLKPNSGRILSQEDKFS